MSITLKKLIHFHVSPDFVKKFITAVIIIAIIHHVDHVLRYDHSGWPFRPDPGVAGAHLITPFSYSLLAYPLLISLYFIKNKIYRIAVAVSIAIHVIFAHAFIELPIYQYLTWANNASSQGVLIGHPNLLHTASPSAGIFATIASQILNITIGILPFLIWRERTVKKSINKLT